MNEIENKIKDYPYQIILGSGSPRRQSLLSSLGFEYLLQPINADESFPEHLVAQQIPIYLAEKKANAFPYELKNSELLITADTIVWCENKVLNKPENYEEAKAMLESLSGRMHEVYTAVCLKSANKQVVFFDCSRVYFKSLLPDVIDYYIKNHNPYDKAGGYGAQDWIGYVAIEKIEGSFFNVMGLPVRILFEELIRF